MPDFACDLHIHSCLSPCGDNSMTPNNLVNMAYLKELDIIAVADHNSAKNLPAIATICEARGLLHIPAIEVETREEVHVLCYLPTVEKALELSEILYDALPDMPCDPRFFGEQIIENDDDEEIGRLEKLLTQATTLAIEEVAEICRSLGGVPVPAHINRESNSLIYSLGFIPPQLGFVTVEVAKLAPPPMGVDLNAYRVLHSSDAHYLENIFERDPNELLTLNEKSVECFLQYISGK